MALVNPQEAADMMGVPRAWVSSMLELGALSPHEGPNGELLIDTDEIIDKHYVEPTFKAVSLEHTRSMLRKLGVQSASPSL